MKRYTVRAKRWEQGWELHIEGVGVTQVRSLARAEQQVRDYLETLYERGMREATIDVKPDLGGIEDLVAEAKRRTRDAEAAQRAAAEQARTVVHKLRASGLSVDETALIMGVSAGRVSQMVKKAAPEQSASRVRPEDTESRAMSDPPATKLRKNTAAARTVRRSPVSTARASQGSSTTSAAARGRDRKRAS